MLQAIFTQLAITCQTGEILVNGVCNPTGLPPVAAGHNQLEQILQIVFGVLAALAVLFIVIGGLRFVLSDGDPQNTVKARNTIIYAVVGLMVAITAEVLVTFVVGKL